MRKTWKQKLETGQPRVEIAERAFAGIPAGSKMLISSPREIAALLAGTKCGDAMTLPELRQKLAAKHGADVTCPLTTSIFLRIVAERAWEEHSAEGKPLDQVVPFWRALSPRDKIAAKLACGLETLKSLRQSEGLPT